MGMLAFLALGGCYVTDWVGGWPIEWQVAWYQNIFLGGKDKDKPETTRRPVQPWPGC